MVLDFEKRRQERKDDDPTRHPSRGWNAVRAPRKGCSEPPQGNTSPREAGLQQPRLCERDHDRQQEPQHPATDSLRSEGKSTVQPAVLRVLPIPRAHKTRGIHRDPLRKQRQGPGFQSQGETQMATPLREAPRIPVAKQAEGGK